MTELNWQQHEELSGSSSDDAFFGGIIAALGDMSMPLKAAQTDGDHFTQIVNLLYSINRRLVNAFQAYIYKDSDDEDDEFSVKPFAVEHRGLTCTFAGATAQGTLTLSSDNLIWTDLSAAPTITIAFGAAWPSTPHIKLGTIAMPASGSWLPDALTSHVGTQAIVPAGGGAAPLRADLAFGSAGSFDVAIVPAGAVVIPVSIVVHTAFDGTAPTIKVGDSGDDDSMFETGDVDLTTPGVYTGQIAKYFAAQETISAAFVPDGSTAGGATIHIDQR